MKWINVDLGNVWPKEKDPEDIYKLILQILLDWEQIRDNLWQCYGNNLNSLGRDYYRLYTTNIIHDGNRQCGMVRWVKDQYDKDGKFPHDISGWASCQSLLGYIRQAEILYEYFNLLLIPDYDGYFHLGAAVGE